jgi:large subunit ribosomal protein L23
MDRHSNVIIKPLITERSTHQQTTRNAYAFKVADWANKPQIRDAVEKLYNVKVTDVRTMNRKGKPRRTKFKVVHTSGYKRAIVVLEENSKIDLF